MARTAAWGVRTSDPFHCPQVLPVELLLSLEAAVCSPEEVLRVKEASTQGREGWQPCPMVYIAVMAPSTLPECSGPPDPRQLPHASQVQSSRPALQLSNVSAPRHPLPAVNTGNTTVRLQRSPCHSWRSLPEACVSHRTRKQRAAGTLARLRFLEGDGSTHWGCLVVRIHLTSSARRSMPSDARWTGGLHVTKETAQP